MKLDDQFTDPWAFGLAKNSELLGTFRNVILSLQESGILSRMKSRWLRNRKLELRDEDHHVVLGFENLSFPFMVLASAVVVSTAFALCEALAHRVCREV